MLIKNICVVMTALVIDSTQTKNLLQLDSFLFFNFLNI